MNPHRYLWPVLLTLMVGAQAVASTLQYGAAPPPGIGGAIELRDMYGKPFTLKQLGNKPALLFFGFAGCSSTCPVAMATARQLLRDTHLQNPPAVLFVTLDPLGDSPQRLQQYLGAFDPRIVGLTGAASQLSKVLDRYGVAVQSPADGIQHSSMWYLIDNQGKVLRVYRYATPADKLASDLQVVQRSARTSQGVSP